MSVLIKGMEMPEGGEHILLLYVDSNGTCSVRGDHRLYPGEPYEAVPVPTPHGRLTMAEYIDRDELLRDIEDSVVFSGRAGETAEIRGANKIMRRIHAAPAADVRPVVRGRWVVSRTDYGWNGAEFPTHCKCDQCGREVPYLDKDNFCPNCGALMDKDGDRE